MSAGHPEVAAVTLAILPAGPSNKTVDQTLDGSKFCILKMPSVNVVYIAACS